MLNNNFSLNNKGVSNAFLTVNQPRHRWYYYKEGFSSELVEKAISDTGLESHDLIIDPFNGSGTVTLTAAINGYRSLGVEVNPFTSFLAKAKLGTVTDATFSKRGEELLKTCNRQIISPLINFSRFSDNGKNEKWLFNKSVLGAFEAGWQATNGLNGDNKRIFRLALIASAMDNCNAKKDGKCLKYKSKWETLNFDKQSFLESLESRIKDIRSDLETCNIQKEAKIICGDIRKVIGTDLNEKFKLCITSPPYLNTFDYTDIYRPELFLGKFIYDNDELYKLRMMTVRSHVQAKWNKPTECDFGSLFVTKYNEIKVKGDMLMHKDIPMMIQAYFEDMKDILRQLRQKATDDASLWMVVSTSAYADIEIPVDLILAEIGTTVGWYLKEIGVLRHVQKRKTKYSPNISELRESVVIFSAKK